jgi:dienelactone hydrolase
LAADKQKRACLDLFAALKTDDATLATRDFNERMRLALPAPFLASVWKTMVARGGPLGSWRTIKREQVRDLWRWTVELEFRDRTAYALVVFDADSRIAGLFFPGHRGDGEHAEDRGAALEGTTKVVVRAHKGDLPGELLLPSTRSPARSPAVVMVAGSGPQDRDEATGSLTPFRDLARGLADYGIASLRYDKRSFARPGSMGPASTVEDEVIADAVAAMRTLRESPYVDPSCTFILGHSLGALLAPEIAVRAGGTQGMILMAPPGRTPLVVTVDQLRRSGVAPAVLAAVEAKVAALATLPADEPLLGASAAYWRDLGGRDEIAIARNLALPILLLRGERDWNVLAVDMEAWSSSLSPQVALDVKVFVGLNHLFVEEREERPDSSSSGLAPGRHVRVDVIDSVARFVLCSTCAASPR